MQPTSARRREARPRECNVARSLEVVGERWTLLVVREILLGANRFDQIARNTGAARNILANRLEALADAGVIVRRRYSDRPPRHEYVPTEAGRALQPVLLTLMDWGDRHLPAGQPAPTVLRHACGERLVPSLVCGCCGAPAEPASLTATRLGGRDR